MLARRSRIHKRQGSKWGHLDWTRRPFLHHAPSHSGAAAAGCAAGPPPEAAGRAVPRHLCWQGHCGAKKKTVKIPAMQTNTHHRHFIRHKIILELVRSGNANGDLEFAVRECSEPKKIPKPQMPPKRQ